MTPSQIDEQAFASLVDRTHALADSIEHAVGLMSSPAGSPRAAAASSLCDIADEHAFALRSLMQEGCFTSAIGLLRLQFEALVRAAFVLHAATDATIESMVQPLSPEPDRSIKHLRLMQMIELLESSGPGGQGALLRRFHERLGRGLNSFVHAGLHPMHRSAGGYPLALVAQALKCSNALAMLSLVVRDEMCPEPSFQGRYRRLHQRHADVLPDLEAFPATSDGSEQPIPG